MSETGGAGLAGRIEGFYAVVPAGGAGTRLWPLSRAGSPKFFHDLTGSGRSLVQATYDRLIPACGADGIVFVTGRRHVDELQRQLPGLTPGQLIAEPSPRDSMAAIALAAAVLEERHGPVVMGSFAADHVIRGAGQFREAVAAAVAVARKGYVVTIGMPVVTPSTAYGYIEMGERLKVAGAEGARAVATFTEKPGHEVAAAYAASGRYRWNAGMFVFATDVLLSHLARLRPALHDGVRAIAAAWDTGARDEVLAARWEELEKIAIDYAIAEPVAAEGGVAVVSGDFGWDDVGDWESVAGLLPPGDGGERVLGDTAVTLVRDSPGAVVVPAAGKQICVLGADGIVVVDTPTALLVTTRERAQEVKQIVDALREQGQGDLL